VLDVLPDSRLKRADFGAVVMDWPVNGRTVRVECVPCFCANCGKAGPFVPKENTTFAFWLCQACHETHGEIAGVLTIPDDVFNQAVEAEMVERFGRVLTAPEILVAADRGQLGRPLELLAAESPFKVHHERN